MLCWKGARGRQWACVGRTRPGHPSKPSRPGFSRPGPLQKVANTPVIFRGNSLLVLTLGGPHERRPVSARRAHRRTRRPDQHRHVRDAHPHRRVRPPRGVGRGVHLVRRVARLENRPHAGDRARECAGGARARGAAAHLCRDEDGQDLLRQGSGHDPGRDPRHRSDAARIRAHRLGREARTDRAGMETSVAGRRTHGRGGPPPEPRLLGRDRRGRDVRDAGAARARGRGRADAGDRSGERRAVPGGEPGGAAKEPPAEGGRGGTGRRAGAGGGVRRRIRDACRAVPGGGPHRDGHAGEGRGAGPLGGRRGEGERRELAPDGVRRGGGADDAPRRGGDGGGAEDAHHPPAHPPRAGGAGSWLPLPGVREPVHGGASCHPLGRRGRDEPGEHGAAVPQASPRGPRGPHADVAEPRGSGGVLHEEREDDRECAADEAAGVAAVAASARSTATAR